MTNPGDKTVQVATKYLHADFGSTELNNLLRFFAEEAPLIQQNWLLVGTEVVEGGFELMIFFLNDRGVQQFKELAKASLGNIFIDGVRVKRGSKHHRDQMVQSFFEIGYIWHSEISYMVQKDIAQLRLGRLKSVLSRSEFVQNQKLLVDGDDLRKFRAAMQLKDFVKAQTLFENIKRMGDLSAINLCFLEYQLWFSQGMFKQIWIDERITDVVRSNRPRVVTEYLLISLWKVIISEIDRGDLSLISDEYMKNMRDLLRSVVMPSSQEGRFCLAVVSASLDEDINNVFGGSKLEESEFVVLKEILESKSIPQRLLDAPHKVAVASHESDFNFQIADILELAEEFRDEGNVRALFKALDFVEVKNQHVEKVAKKLVRCICDELVPDFADMAIKRLDKLNLDVSNWSKNLVSAYEKLKNMAQVYSNEWPGLLEMSLQMLAENQRIIIESSAGWSISKFKEESFDESFAVWLVNSDPSIVKDEFLDILTDRLTSAKIGMKSLSAIENIRDPDRPKKSSANLSEQVSAVLDEIKIGESRRLEFKASLRSPINGDEPTKELRGKLEFAVVKTIAAMLHNEDGGKLLIGVGDDGQILGIQVDYQSSQKIGDRDGFERHLRQLILDKIGNLGPSEVGIRFELVNGLDIAIIDCPASSGTRLVKDGELEQFFVRDGNRTLSLSMSEFHAFLRRRGWNQN